ncbi:hypothetical protein TanjilG_11771 [Lupinus angustifolius]|uniref:Uncharacterized protein n=1 Tax=Lupinus angustifolius TaxID=3871 RepID=A0A4P1R659_LUPAN|nr:PREDICTED: uncharacterized protein LOC109357638 [Lupinus angustifolius]OIW03134.1 hypothetical protein TanjilG_11771 [Lupinus angustifolius]
MMLEMAGFTRAVSSREKDDDVVVKKVLEEEEQCSTSSFSSIGKNSEEVSMGEDSEENEVESCYKYNGSLNAMETLEEVLPIRRSISNFYNGKSKSFTSLADAALSTQVRDIAKPENAYTRRRRNLMAFNHGWDKNRNSFPFRSSNGGITKRTVSTSRSSLALALAMNNSDSSSSFTSEDSTSSLNSLSPLLPPLHPRNKVLSFVTSPSSPLQQNFSAWRSFSVADLQQHCAIAAATIKIPNSSLGNETARSS